MLRALGLAAGLAALISPSAAQAQDGAKPAATARKAKAKAGNSKAAPVKRRRMARPAAGQASARPVPVPDSSDARSALAYRTDAARHLYSMNLDQIYKGRMPPLLYAVGVLQVQVDPEGRVGRLSWMRAPNHAPEVVREIERIVRRAEPFPPHTMARGVTYTDTWLWHKSGKWQLHTLTEGQD